MTFIYMFKYFFNTLNLIIIILILKQFTWF